MKIEDYSDNAIASNYDSTVELYMHKLNWGI